ncbi:hypothetical protein [Acinetobacter puyangensis]|uniref:hypothetical protein n=1 Tax=Acinetobacter puyangensis TaxID=1096779 RepID=UPI003A4D55AB
MSEFKVGDLVVTKDPFYGEALYTIRDIHLNYQGKSFALFDSGFWILTGIRHATPKEIAAGHRLDHSVQHHEMIVGRID